MLPFLKCMYMRRVVEKQGRGRECPEPEEETEANLGDKNQSKLYRGSRWSLCTSINYIKAHAHIQKRSDQSWNPGTAWMVRSSSDSIAE